MNIAIVVIAFNRPESLKRLLSSISRAEYNNDNVTLVISIDYQDSEPHAETLVVAKNFEWMHGEKKIIEHKNNLGLRKHVLSCGCLTETYPAIIMLEDDLFVSKQYYDYAQQMLETYGNSNQISGISLYSHQWNVNVNRPFIPEPSEYDVYLIQFAQSWGQCWNVRMWKEFYKWYQENENNIIEGENIPSFVKNWPKSSWLKYFISYTIKSNKYFVYPYYSLTTNFSDSGTHNKILDASFQVVLQDNRMQYRIPLIDNAIKYDAFFEREDLSQSIGFIKSDLMIDLYGSKRKTNENYILTTKALPFKIIASYGLCLRPHELNIIHNIEGKDIFLYDTAGKVVLKNKRNNNIRILQYDYKNLNFRKLIYLLKDKLISKLYENRI